MRIARILGFLGFFVILLLNRSCEKDEFYSYQKDHTVIVYMLANNDLYSNALTNINKMESVWNNSFNGNLVVIIEPKDDDHKIYVIEITHDNDIKSVNSPITKTYNDKRGVMSHDMNYLISDVIKDYPSKKYSLILWSHGTGWLPSNIVLSFTRSAVVPIKSKSFGESNDVQMEIHELANGIPDNVFETILFDACLMGSIEVIYELKDKSNYIIASPTEILADGFPYETIVPLLFTTKTDVNSIGAAFFKYYDEQDGPYRSATIGVVKTSELIELAIKTRILMNSINPKKELFDKIGDLQVYDRYKNNVFYDFKESIEFLYDKTDEYIYLFQNQLDKTVLYKANTPEFMETFSINNCSGLSCFLPNQYHDPMIINYYKNLKWYNDSGFDILF